MLSVLGRSIGERPDIVKIVQVCSDYESFQCTDVQSSGVSHARQKCYISYEITVGFWGRYCFLNGS
jgi:hypothetical protein